MTNEEALPILNYIKLSVSDEKQKAAIERAMKTLESEIRQLRNAKRKRFNNPDWQTERNHRYYLNRKGRLCGLNA